MRIRIVRNDQVVQDAFDTDSAGWIDGDMKIQAGVTDGTCTVRVTDQRGVGSNYELGWRDGNSLRVPPASEPPLWAVAAAYLILAYCVVVTLLLVIS